MLSDIQIDSNKIRPESIVAYKTALEEHLGPLPLEWNEEELREQMTSLMRMYLILGRMPDPKKENSEEETHKKCMDLS